MDYNARSLNSHPETMLVQQAQAGNRSAFDRLVRHYRPLLLGLAYMRTSSWDAADDLVQDVLARAWQKLPNLQNPAAFPAWLKTITAHTCSNWHGRVRSPASLSEEPACETWVDRQPTPLEAVLAQEKRHELDRALSSLPTSNRLALVLFALEGFSYQEIAGLTGVPASTIDGRIRRARAQLRRLLAPDDTGRIEVADRAQPHTENRKVPLRRRETMTTTTPRPDQLAQARALTIFTFRLATFVESGLPVVRAVNALRDVPAPYGKASEDLYTFLQEAAEEESAPIYSAERMFVDWLYNPDRYPTLIEHINRAIEQQRCLLPSRSQGLAKALTQQSDLFSQFYTDVVYHGDNAGMLDATLRHLATLLEKQWQLANNRPKGEDPVLCFLPAGKLPAKDWTDLTAYQQHVTLVMLLRGFAVALECNVPILHTMRLMALVLPEPQGELWLGACDAIKQGDPVGPSLRRMTVFPDFVVELISIGEELGSLDSTLTRAADLLEYESERLA